MTESQDAGVDVRPIREEGLVEMYISIDGNPMATGIAMDPGTARELAFRLSLAAIAIEE